MKVNAQAIVALLLIVNTPLIVQAALIVTDEVAPMLILQAVIPNAVTVIEEDMLILPVIVQAAAIVLAPVQKSTLQGKVIHAGVIVEAAFIDNKPVPVTVIPAKKATEPDTVRVCHAVKAILFQAFWKVRLHARQLVFHTVTTEVAHESKITISALPGIVQVEAPAEFHVLQVPIVFQSHPAVPAYKVAIFFYIKNNKQLLLLLLALMILTLYVVK